MTRGSGHESCVDLRSSWQLLFEDLQDIERDLMATKALQTVSHEPVIASIESGRAELMCCAREPHERSDHIVSFQSSLLKAVQSSIGNEHSPAV